MVETKDIQLKKILNITTASGELARYGLSSCARCVNLKQISLHFIGNPIREPNL